MGPYSPWFGFASEDVLAERTELIQYYDKKEDTEMGDFSEKIFRENIQDPCEFSTIWIITLLTNNMINLPFYSWIFSLNIQVVPSESKLGVPVMKFGIIGVKITSALLYF